MNRYTNFILTVIAVVLLGILFKADFNSPANAAKTMNSNLIEWHFDRVHDKLDEIIEMLEYHTG
jgi:hypothetical protein|tara:strand:+ start:454 stop:645 length:192 start_codon:yes stop_codon:yes gene_type:complete